MLTFVFIIVVLVLLVSYIVSTVVKPKNYPPGPRWYPFFGCNGIISSRMKQHGSQWKVISDMAKEYSTKILGLNLGGELVVVVCGEKNIRRVASEKEFDARPDSFFLRLRTFGRRIGITFVDGPLWREHRPFALKQMRNSGFGRQSMSVDIQTQLNRLLNLLDRSDGNPTSLKQPASIAMLNILWKYVAGEHIHEDKLKHFLKLTSARSEVFTMAGGYLNQWPWLRFIFPKWSGYTIIKEMNEQLLEIIQDSITKHKNKNIDGNDLIYSFLEEMRGNKDTYTEDQLTGVCLDILIAASNTGSSALNFAFILLLSYPNAQDKIYEEITRILGSNPPTWADNSGFVYTTAFLSEVQRLCTIAPFAGTRRALSDVEMDGYLIPKGTTILMSLGDLHSDAEFWDKPDRFKPERFINETGELRNLTSVYPFSLGRRRCPGEPLARSFIFIMFVGILQKYKIVCNGPPPSPEPIIGILAEPRDFAAKFVKRQL